MNLLFIVSVICICFSPQEDCGKMVIEQIKCAVNTIDIAAYSITDSEIIAALNDAKENGVEIRLLLDKVQAAGRKSISRTWKDCCIDIRSGLMHDKIMIIDGNVLITGSYNFTNNARKSNDENLLVIFDGNIIKKYENQFEILWERHKCQK